MTLEHLNVAMATGECDFKFYLFSINLNLEGFPVVSGCIGGMEPLGHLIVLMIDD